MTKLTEEDFEALGVPTQPPAQQSPDLDLSALIQWEPVFVGETAELIYWRASRRGIYVGRVQVQGHFWAAWAYPLASSNPQFLGYVEDWFEATQRVQDWWADFDQRAS